MTATAEVRALDALTPEGFEEAQRETLAKEISIWPARAWYPSSIGNPCDRFCVWRFTKHQEQQPHDTTLQSIFDEGNVHQPSVYKRLEAIGYQVVRESDRPRQWTVKGATISGRIDGKLMGFRGAKFPQPVILEIKTTQDHTWKRLNTIDDVRHADQHYVRAYDAQGQLYCLLEDVEHGVMVLKSKATGLLKLIPFTLDMARAEAIIQRIERLQAFVKDRRDPDPITYDSGICGGCGFNHLCWPAKDYGPGLQVLEDVALVQDFAREYELADAAHEHDRLNKANRAALKKLGTFELASLGPFLIERKEVPVKEFTVKARTDVRFTITKPGVKELE